MHVSSQISTKVTKPSIHVFSIVVRHSFRGSNSDLQCSVMRAGLCALVRDGCFVCDVDVDSYNCNRVFVHDKLA